MVFLLSRPTHEIAQELQQERPDILLPDIPLQLPQVPVPPPPPPPVPNPNARSRGRGRLRIWRLKKHRRIRVFRRPPKPRYSVRLTPTASETAKSLAAAEELKMWEEIKQFEDDFADMEKKIHKFPRALSSLYKEYGAQVAVHIGLHMPLDCRVYESNTVKSVAMHHFRSGTTFGSVEEMFKDFCSAVGDVYRLYRYRLPSLNSNLDVLRDGCFLLEYMKVCTIGPDDSMPKLLAWYFESNKAAIDRDIMLLENQLPWVVIQTLGRYQQQVHMTVKKFVAKMARTMQVRRGPDDSRLPDLEGKPSHLLGLLRSYKIGYNVGTVVVPMPSDGTIRPMSRTINVIELAEIGIKLTASKTTRFIDMGLKKTLLGAEIFLAPLLLDETRLCWLVNMAALEICEAPYAASSTNDAEKFAVSAYLVVFAMLMDRQEDVHALRSKGLVQGELTNKEILHFFKVLVKHISGGPLYTHLMEEIEDYKIKRRMWIKLYKFIYKNYKTIAAVLSIAGVLAGIFRTLLSLKQH